MAIRETYKHPDVGKPARWDRSVWMRQARDGPATQGQLACLRRIAERMNVQPPMGWSTLTRKQASRMISDGLGAWPVQ